MKTAASNASSKAATKATPENVVRKLWSPDNPDSQANCLHRLVGLFRQFRDDMPSDMTADRIIAYCEQFGLGWSLDHTGRLIEARIWNWPNVVGRYRPHKVEPLALMLWMALRNAHDSLPNDERSNREEKTV